LTKVHKTLPYTIHNMGILGQFAQFLTYKTEKASKRIIRIDESHTSQQCCMCRNRMKRALSERVIMCDCENRIDRDLNSAISILKYFINQKQHFDFLSHQSSMIILP
jgi:putative transposase